MHSCLAKPHRDLARIVYRAAPIPSGDNGTNGL